jgi:putative addiction module component (TIGR02574 family)
MDGAQPSLAKVTEDALRLTPDERAELADRLQDSVTATEWASEEIAQAWRDEAERRLAEYRAGKVEGIPADVAMDMVRARLRACR